MKFGILAILRSDFLFPNIIYSRYIVPITFINLDKPFNNSPATPIVKAIMICKNILPDKPPQEYGNPALNPKLPPICANSKLFGPGVIEFVRDKIARVVMNSSSML